MVVVDTAILTGALESIEHALQLPHEHHVAQHGHESVPPQPGYLVFDRHIVRVDGDGLEANGPRMTGDGGSNDQALWHGCTLPYGATATQPPIEQRLDRRPCGRRRRGSRTGSSRRARHGNHER